MPVSFAQPPSEVRQVTQDKLQEIAGRNEFRVEALVSTKPEQIGLASGHPVYNLGLADIVHGKPLAQLALTSWRFIVDNGAAQATAAETLGGGPTGPARFASVNDGPFVAGTTAAFATVSSDPLFAKGDWEIRVLRVPALYVFAVWTHDKTAGADLLRPIAPAPDYLDPSKSYRWDEFIAAIKPHAQEKLAMDGERRG